jgi:hypothetical protein
MGIKVTILAFGGAHGTWSSWQYLRVWGGAAWTVDNSENAKNFIVLARDGTIKTLYTRISYTVPGFPSTITFRVRKNGADQTLQTSHNLRAAEFQKSDLANSFGVAAGDRVSMSGMITGATTDVQVMATMLLEVV